MWLCGMEPPPDSRFRDKCDTPVTQATQPAEYEQVTAAHDFDWGVLTKVRYR